MRVGDIMTRGIEFLPADYTISDAARKMRDLDIGVIPVSRGETIVGILTDRDIVVRAIAENLDPGVATVQEIMTGPVYTCSEETSVEDAARIMEEVQVRRLIVEDRDGHVTGIVSLGDIAVNTGKELSGAVLQGVSEPSEPRR